MKPEYLALSTFHMSKIFWNSFMLVDVKFSNFPLYFWRNHRDGSYQWVHSGFVWVYLSFSINYNACNCFIVCLTVLLLLPMIQFFPKFCFIHVTGKRWFKSWIYIYPHTILLRYVLGKHDAAINNNLPW